MVRVVFVAAAAGLLAGCLGGCASITRGTTDQIQILSEPPGANVQTSLGHACLTPCILTIPRKDTFNVSFSKPGFHPVQFEVVKRVPPEGAAGFAGNILIGGVVGMVADAATGAAFDHCPKPVSVRLTPLREPPPPPPEFDCGPKMPDHATETVSDRNE
jgi:hypothetical protein